MRQILVLLFIILNISHLSAQTIEEIKNNSSLFWAEGVGESMDEADKLALAELSRQISVSVYASTFRKSESDGKNNSIQQSNEVTISSNAIFNNIEMRVLQESPIVRVIRWISKSEIEKQQKDRLIKIQEMVRVANKALEGKQIADAIRYYYWAYSLLGTLPNNSTIKVEDENYEEQFANIWLPNKIKETFCNIKCVVLEKSSDGINEYNVAFLYKGENVAGLDFSYFDGSDWSPICSAIDGRSVVELRPSYTPDQLMIRYEYKFLGEARSDKEVEKVLTTGNVSYFDRVCKSSVKLAISNKDVKESQKKLKQLEDKNLQVSNILHVNKKDVDKCNKSMHQIIAAIRNKSYLSVTNLFTSNGYDVFTKLINYGSAKVIGEPTLTYTQFGEDIICRGVLMNFSFSGNRKFSENVVFTFDSNYLVDNISFGLGEVAQDNLMGHIGSSFTPEIKQIIANFLECFKTAYALKRLDYLEQIFADDALIITGKVLYKKAEDKDTSYKNNRYVQLTKQDKATYIKHLRRCFASKEFINIKFANNRIRHTKTKGVYGIQIKQDYFSSNYGDTGYLFLLVDVRNPKEPIIYVRAWQEKPDPEWGLVGIENFDNIE